MIGERLLQLRKEKGMTQQELAKQLGITKYTISSYEADKSAPSDELKVQIAKIFDISTDYLLGLVDQPLSYRKLERAVILPENTPDFRSEVEQYIYFLYYKKYHRDLPPED